VIAAKKTHFMKTEVGGYFPLREPAFFTFFFFFPEIELGMMCVFKAGLKNTTEVLIS
jgi:hypothetical protein